MEKSETPNKTSLAGVTARFFSSSSKIRLVALVTAFILTGYGIAVRDPYILFIDWKTSMWTDDSEQACLAKTKSGPEVITWLKSIPESVLDSQNSANHYDIAIGRCEVTFNDYALYARDRQRPLPDDNRWGRAQRPVINVNFDDEIKGYLDWLSQASSAVYRLPTLQEWEKLQELEELQEWEDLQSSNVRSENHENGNDQARQEVSETAAERNCASCKTAWSGKSTRAVGYSQRSIEGRAILNLFGNVSEWVMDCQHYNGTGELDSVLRTSHDLPEGCKLIIKGASWFADEPESPSTEDARSPSVGFRVVRIIPGFVEIPAEKSTTDAIESPAIQKPISLEGDVANQEPVTVEFPVTEEGSASSGVLSYPSSETPPITTETPPTTTLEKGDVRR